MKTILRTISGILFFLAANSSPASAQTPPEEYLKDVGFIFGQSVAKVSDGRQITIDGPLGTAFFVLYPDMRGGPNFVFCYAVTAKHVLRNSDGTFLRSIRIRINLREPLGDQGYDFVDVPVSDQQGNLIWLHDLANDRDEAVAFPILPDPNRFDFKAPTLDQFADEAYLKNEHVSPGDNLFFVGLLPQFYGRTKNYPVLRKGSIALLPAEEVPTPVGPEHGYIAEVASWPGNSGAPVFLYLTGQRSTGFVIGGGGPRLFGIIVSQYNNSRAFDVVENSSVGIQDPSSIGLAFVQPATDLIAVLNGTQARALRDAQIKAKQPHN